MILYAAVSLLNYFFCDRAIIDKTLFFDIFIGQTFIWPVLACTNMQCECGHWRQVETT